MILSQYHIVKRLPQPPLKSKALPVDSGHWGLKKKNVFASLGFYSIIFNNYLNLGLVMDRITRKTKQDILSSCLSFSPSLFGLKKLGKITLK